MDHRAKKPVTCPLGLQELKASLLDAAAAWSHPSWTLLRGPHKVCCCQRPKVCSCTHSPAYCLPEGWSALLPVRKRLAASSACALRFPPCLLVRPLRQVVERSRLSKWGTLTSPTKGIRKISCFKIGFCFLVLQVVFSSCNSSLSFLFLMIHYDVAK